MWYLLAFAALALGCTLDDSGGNFYPNQRYIVSMRPLVPEARALLTVRLMDDACRYMASEGLFRCNSTWSDGLAGYMLSSKDIFTRVRKHIGARYENVTYEVYADSFFEYPSGIRSSVRQKLVCGNSTDIPASNVTTYLLDDGDTAGSHATHMAVTGVNVRYVRVRKLREDGWVSDLIAGLDTVLISISPYRDHL